MLTRVWPVATCPRTTPKPGEGAGATGERLSECRREEPPPAGLRGAHCLIRFKAWSPRQSRPLPAIDGEPLTIEVAGLERFVGSPAQTQLRGTDDIATQPVASAGATVDAAGIARASLSLHLGRETLVEVDDSPDHSNAVNERSNSSSWDSPSREFASALRPGPAADEKVDLAKLRQHRPGLGLLREDETVLDTLRVGAADLAEPAVGPGEHALRVLHRDHTDVLDRAETGPREKHADAVVGFAVRGREIDLAVAVQITARKRDGLPSGRVVEPRFEIPIPAIREGSKYCSCRSRYSRCPVGGRR